MDGICVHCAKCTAGRALCGVCTVAAGAAGAGVAGARAVGSLTAWMARADEDAAGATSPMFDVSGLHLDDILKCGHEHICAVHNQ